MSQQITVDQLHYLGFRIDDCNSMDDGRYECYILPVHEINMFCTVEYDDQDKVTNQYFEIAELRLRGRIITIKDIELLKEIL